MTPHAGTALLLVSLAALSACKVREGKAPGKVPANISIPVTVEGGEPGATIDSAWLGSREPDFRDAEDQRAWRVGALVPAAEAPGALLEVQSADGPATELRTGPQAVAVVTFNKSGQPVVQLIDPTQPFPSFHGRGGNRGRSGSDERVRAVTGIRVIPGS
jgi:hypothetical protein